MWSLISEFHNDSQHEMWRFNCGFETKLKQQNFEWNIFENGEKNDEKCFLTIFRLLFLSLEQWNYIIKHCYVEKVFLFWCNERLEKCTWLDFIISGFFICHQLSLEGLPPCFAQLFLWKIDERDFLILKVPTPHWCLVKFERSESSEHSRNRCACSWCELVGKAVIKLLLQFFCLLHDAQVSSSRA